MEYYFMMECPNCEHENYDLALNGVQYKGKPVFDPFMFSQMSMRCEKCEHQFGTGDIDIIDFEE